MKYFKTLLPLFYLILISCSPAAKPNDTLFVAFWNLENLFDTVNDPNKNDEEFLPNSNLEWTQQRFDKKIYNLSRVIRSMNGNSGPDILGVCEVENKNVLDSMTQKYLNDLNYDIVHVESPDKRGIDVALLYRDGKFDITQVTVDTVHLSDGWPTRPVLGVHMQNEYKKDFTVFVNHWPSRSGGEVESEPNRIEAAKTLRNAIDKVLRKDPLACIISIGDYNDEPGNESILETLKAHPVICDSVKSGSEINTNYEVFNLAYKEYAEGNGTLKYKDNWNLLDQVIVSGNVLTGNTITYICDSYTIYKPYFLQTHSGKYAGTPFPTYGGRKYLGGYSDHYPVFAKFLMEGK
jgi:endonuclease/exonuclease/phosphatase family metal-dependent hydrolase